MNSATSIASSKEWAWKQFIEATKALTDLGCIKWQRDCDDMSSHISLLVTEIGEGDEYRCLLRVWNNSDDEKVLSYDNDGEDVNSLCESVQKRSAVDRSREA